MQVKFEQLNGHLSKGLAPVYFITGDEPLLQQEATDLIRLAAKNQGYDEREIFHADKTFDWNTLMQSADALSLFAQLRIFDVKMPSAKPGQAGAKILKEYCERLPEDTILIISAGKLEANSKNSAWVKALDKVGVVITLWPIDAQRLPGWIDQRMRERGMSAERDSVRLIADRVEGNLLAAAQEVDKLNLLFGEGQISADQINSAVADSARFDVFGLVDAALSGNVARVTRMMNGLKIEGIEPILVLWALSREIRSLASIAFELSSGQSLNNALSKARIWTNRKQIVSNAIKRNRPEKWQQLLAKCFEIDKSIKGMKIGKPWQELQELGVAMAGIEVAGVK